MESIQIGVRDLISFVMRSGDIDTAYRSNRRLLEGIRVHQKIQSAYGAGFEKEVFFRDCTEYGGILFVVEGRADGVLVEKERILIDEIKSTVRPLASLTENGTPLHWAQVKCYAHFYAKKHDKKEITVQLTYVNLDEEPQTRLLERTLSAKELEVFYHDLLEKYLSLSRRLIAWRAVSHASLRGANFPYPSYRQGQRKMAVGVYQALEEKKTLFVEAPTGIGKTISALFPAVRAIESLGVNKVYYLTTKTTTQREPQKALSMLAQNGLRLKYAQLTARDKICLNDRVSCNPNDCPYAKGHFDRVNDAILDLFDGEDAWDRKAVLAYAKKHQVCPFEFQLDLSNFADVVLGDVNYFFDPAVFLRRAFEEDATNTVILVDEAHNMVDRGREMYRAALSTEDIDRMLSFFSEKKNRLVHRALLKAKAAIYEFHDTLGAPDEIATDRHPDTLRTAAEKIRIVLDSYMAKEMEDPNYEEVRQFFFDIVSFLRIDATWNRGFQNLLTRRGKNITWTIQCIDTADLMEEALSKVRSAVFFSATLSPMQYYRHLLGGDTNSLVLHLRSPFDPAHLSIEIAPLETRYRYREQTLPALVKILRQWIGEVRVRLMNAMVFFPSYAYLGQVVDQLVGEEILIQEAGASDEAQQAILLRYRTERGLIGFFVLGGSFSEGIDLPGEALSACAIVSLGLPGVSFERNVIRTYFDQTMRAGFDYAYTFPGMNRVLQAAGRLIRTEEDRGRLLLIDRRFEEPRIRRLFPPDWTPKHWVGNDKES